MVMPGITEQNKDPQALFRDLFKRLRAGQGQAITLYGEAASQYGIDIGDEIGLKASLNEAGDGLQINYVTPPSWTDMGDGSYRSPDGHVFNAAPIDLPGNMFEQPEVPAPPMEGVTQYDPELKALISKLWPSDDFISGPEQVIGWAIDNQDDFVARLQGFGHTQDTEALLKKLYPEITQPEIEAFYGIDDAERQRREKVSATLSSGKEIVQHLRQRYQEFGMDETFIEMHTKHLENEYARWSDEAVKEFWYTPPTEDGISDWYAKYRGMKPVGYQADRYLRMRTGEIDVAELSLGDTALHSFALGTADVTSAVAGGLEALGLDVPDFMSDYEEKIRTFYREPERTLGDFEISHLVEPEFWATTMVRSVPFSGALVPVALLGAVAGGEIAAAAGAGTIVTWIAGSAGSVALSRPIESFLEAGSTYNDAIEKDMTPEEAKKAFADTFKGNMVLAGADLFQIGVALMPMPGPLKAAANPFIQTAKVGGKVVIVGLTEGGEEAYQDYIQRVALGEDVALDAQMKEAIAVGFVYGAGLGFGGDIISRVTENSRRLLKPEIAHEMDVTIEAAKKEGRTDALASLQGLEVALENASGAEAVLRAVNEASKQTVSTTMPAQISEAQEIVDATLFTEEGRSISAILKKTGWSKGQYADISVAKYKLLTGQAPAANMISKGKVKASEAVNVLAKQQGYGSPAEFRVAVNNVSTAMALQDAVNLKRQESQGAIDSFTLKELRGLQQDLTTDTPTRQALLKANGEKYIAKVVRQLEEKIARLTKSAEMEKEYELKPDPAPKPADTPADAELSKHISFEDQSPGVVDKFKKSWREFNRKMIDDLAPLKKFVDTFTKGGVKLSIEEDPYLLARLLRGVNSKATMFLEHGTFGAEFWRMEGGKAVPNYTGEGLEAIVTEAVDYQAFARYLTYRRAVELSKVVRKMPAKELKGIIAQLQGQVTALSQALKAKSAAKAAKVQPMPAEEIQRQAFASMNVDDRSAFRVALEQQIQDIQAMMDEQTAELEEAKAWLQSDWLAAKKVWLGKRDVSLTYFIKKGDFPETFTVKEAAALTQKSEENVQTRVYKKGVRTNRVPRAVVLDSLTEQAKDLGYRFESDDDLVDHIFKIANYKQKVKDLSDINEIGIDRVPEIRRMIATLEAVERGEVAPLTPAPVPPGTVPPAGPSVEGAQRGEKVGIETGINPDTAQRAIGELEEKYSNFPDLAERIYRYQRALLDYAQEMGLISEEMVERLSQQDNYVPFFRVFNELQSRGYMGSKMADIASPIKRIKGSEREIVNPLESIIKNTHIIISAAERNRVGIMMANLVDHYPELADTFVKVRTPIRKVASLSAADVGLEVDGFTEAENEQVLDIFRPAMITPGDEVVVLIDGQKHYYRVDEELKNALLKLDREDMGMWGKLLGLPTRLLRAGATLNPDFMIRNPARDQWSAMIYSKYGFIPGWDFMKGVASILRKDADYELFKLSGAEHSMLVSMDRTYLRTTFNDIVHKERFVKYLKNPIEVLRILSELGERATRLGEFKKGISRGARPMEAGFGARDVTLDFAKAGTAAHAANRFIAFFNANIRGWDKMITSFRDHPARTSLKVFTGITLPSIMLYYINRDDPRWEEIPQWQKDLFWIIFTDDAIIRIPKPFELGVLFGSIPERFCEWLDNRDPDMMKEAMISAAEAGAPGFIPTAGLPILEWITNYSFFRGMPLVPKSRQSKPMELQYTRWTTETAKGLGALLNISPSKVENLITGWTGGLGRYALQGMDAVLTGTGIVTTPPEATGTWADVPVIKAFIVRSPYGSSGQAVTNFYEELDRYGEGEQYLKEMLKLGEQEKYEKYLAAHPELLFFYDYEGDDHYSATARYLRSASSILADIGRKQDEVYRAEDMTPKEKREKIDELDKLKTEVAKRALSNLQGDTPTIIQAQLAAADLQLGDVLGDTPVLSLEPPDVYNIRDLNSAYNKILDLVPREDAEKMEGMSPVVSSWYDKRELVTETGAMINTPIYLINADPVQGDTFEQYHSQWQERMKITDAAELAAFDKQYPKAYLGNLTRSQYKTLQQYHSLDSAAQSVFLSEHPELRDNPRKAWLIANPKENATMALWGETKIYSVEAYNQLKQMATELDIPLASLPEYTLPPINSLEDYFRYSEIGETLGWNSWEAKLLLAENDELRDFLKRDDIDTPIEALRLYVKHRGLYDQQAAYGDPDSPDYIADDDARAEAIAQLKVDNPEWVADTRRIQAIEKDAPPHLIEEWVDRGTVIDEFKAGSSEAKAWLLDHKEAWDWALEQGLLTDDGSSWNRPVIRINTEWAQQDDEYDAISFPGDPTRQAQERQAYLEANPDYRQARRERDAFSLRTKDGETFPEQLVPQYVEYHELGTKGFRQERYLLENKTFADAMHRIAGIDLPDAAKVPAVQYDDIYDAYRPQFEQLDGLADINSEHYIEDPEKRAAARDRLRYRSNGGFTQFGAAEKRRQAFGLFIPEQYVESYVEYAEIQAIGKPGGQDLWYEDDWYLMEHQEYYNKVYLGILGLERKDFTKVPTKEVFALYQIYEDLPLGRPRYDFRAKWPELDDWLVAAFDMKPVGRRGNPGAPETVWERNERIREYLRRITGGKW